MDIIMNKITAEEGMVFQRIHDSMMFGNEIYLGIDYSTGTAREDKREYYEEIEEPEIIINSLELNNTELNSETT